ncbi:hypothetical protein GGI1_23901, partial [Acidithiobacillus sp. GGI-221]
MEYQITGLIDAGATLEEDVDIGIPEHRVAAHGLGAGHLLQGGLQGIGHLILNDLRSLARIG